MQTEHIEFERTMVRMLDNLTADEIAEGTMERKNVQEVGTVAKRIEFQPGNGTRYECFLVPLSNEETLFAWVRGGSGPGNVAVLRLGGLLHYSYFMEKMSINSLSDAHALLQLIQEETGREVVLPSEELDIPYENTENDRA